MCYRRQHTQPTNILGRAVSWILRPLILFAIPAKGYSVSLEARFLQPVVPSVERIAEPPLPKIGPA
jgi:hypothetical protein